MNTTVLKPAIVSAFIGVLTLGLTSTVSAHQTSGAIFTTVADGSEVNFNHYAAKEDVYLDGGPGPGAPQHAAGLDDGEYVFQVTDPSGKVLLSTDPAGCRRFTVSGGIITSVASAGSCAHVTGLDIDHGALTVQLMPYDDTPNPGGVYKVWVTRWVDFELGVSLLGNENPTTVVDPGLNRNNKHGFIPAHSKTDNFKVKAKNVIEIDTRFWDSQTGEILDGLGVTWIDTHGASNKKFSYWAPHLNVYHEAHVEAVEDGVHTIMIGDGPGYTINHIHRPDGSTTSGPGNVSVRIPNTTRKDLTIFIDVEVDVQY